MSVCGANIHDRKTKSDPHLEFFGNLPLGRIRRKTVGYNFGNAVANPREQIVGLVHLQVFLDRPCFLQRSPHALPLRLANSIADLRVGALAKQFDKGDSEVAAADINGQVAADLLARGQLGDGGWEELLVGGQGEVSIDLGEAASERVEARLFEDEGLDKFLDGVDVRLGLRLLQVRGDIVVVDLVMAVDIAHDDLFSGHGLGHGDGVDVVVVLPSQTTEGAG